MKKTFLAGVALVTLALSSCSGNKIQTMNDSDSAAADSTKTELTYAGLIPAADTGGVEYTLKLKDGKFNLTRVYGEKNSQPTETVEGDYKVVERTDAAPYYELTAPGDTLYFVADNDTTLTMVGKDLKPAASGLIYNLYLQK